ncbi:MAG: phenylalanine--tRNA ligase beta subunit-related protein [Bacilli bacterium]
MTITISPELLRKIPGFDVLAYEMNITVTSSQETEAAIQAIEQKIKEEYSLEDILNIPLIKEGRDGYKALGKDPSRYRLACESLLRRLVKGYGLYRINNVVDAGNLLSIALFRSTAILDRDAIQGDIFIRLGTSKDVYEGIGRGLLNVESIPLYQDDYSPFGSPTSDTERTMIKDSTTHIVVMVICFGPKDVQLIDEVVTSFFTTYAHAQQINKITTNKG